MITVKNAESIWTPLAGPAAARHYKQLLVWNRRSAWVAAFSIAMGLVAGLLMRFHHTLAANVIFAICLAGLVVMLPLVVNRLREWFRFRVAAREFLNVTPEERPDFACLTPDVMAAWIAKHRPPA